MAATVPVPTARRTATLVVARSDSLVTVRVALQGFTPGTVASSTALVRFDGRRLTYLGEEAFNDGALRAARASGDLITVATAHAQGLPDGTVAVLRFRPVDTAGPDGLGLRVTELHLTDATDALPGLSVSPSATMLMVTR
jgi:hypothetical protein